MVWSARKSQQPATRLNESSSVLLKMVICRFKHFSKGNLLSDQIMAVQFVVIRTYLEIRFTISSPLTYLPFISVLSIYLIHLKVFEERDGSLWNIEAVEQ